MNKNPLWKAIENRRSFYAIDDQINYSPEQIKEVVDLAVKHVPSAFNNQSTRLVLLTGEQHKKLWDLTKKCLKEKISAEAFVNTEKKIDTSFRAGFGTILYFIADSDTQALMQQFPQYASNFPTWAEQSSGMHQYILWTLLVDMGLGVSIQHYNPLIDQEVQQTWNIDKTWRLVAQMPFGRPLEEPGAKDFKPVEERSLLFK
ncbi:MAG: nitroreductase family protein [Bacteroides sp.]